MNRKNLFRIAAVIIALLGAGSFMFLDWGLGLAPMARFFVIFCGLIIGLQTVPALIMFITMARGVSRQPAAKFTLSVKGGHHARS